MAVVIPYKISINNLYNWIQEHFSIIKKWILHNHYNKKNATHLKNLSGINKIWYNHNKIYQINQIFLTISLTLASDVDDDDRLIKILNLILDYI